jgi:small subunit ribosomal protein S9
MAETINATGRRKTSVARVYMNSGKGKITVNDIDYKQYFPVATLQYKIKQAFAVSGTEGKFDLTVNVTGGGINGQAEAIRLGIARALIKHDPSLKPTLKAEGLVTRDPRMVERKKPGQKKARKRFQFSKR